MSWFAWDRPYHSGVIINNILFLLRKSWLGKEIAVEKISIDSMIFLLCNEQSGES